jgi:hypothetical protein
MARRNETYYTSIDKDLKNKGSNAIRFATQTRVPGAESS